MSNGFFGRLARKWWLMLVIGVVIGLAAGIPAGGRLMPGELAGSVVPQYMSVEPGANFSIVLGASNPPWKLGNYHVNAFDYKGESPAGTFNFYAKGAKGSAGWIMFGNGVDGKAFGVKIGW